MTKILFYAAIEWLKDTYNRANEALKGMSWTQYHCNDK